VGFLDPANLVYAASLALLVLIYLRARSRPTLEVSSLMLFEPVPAPVAKSRILRVDLVFWLELLALGALTLAAAGLYVRRSEAARPHRGRALVFDLGAGMGAQEGRSSRLEEAKDAALEMVARAPVGDEFSVIGYALEAETVRARSAHREEVRKAIAGLRPLAVAARPAALGAALIDARGAAEVDLFADRPPPANVIADARARGRVNLHLMGGPAGNLAIVALDPGVAHGNEGRCVIRNFSVRPQVCELRIDAGGKEVFHSSLIVEPRAQMIVPFGPLAGGGLVHARILTPDALAADNERYALAPSIAQAHALVMSPEAGVRDDLARIVLAINPNFVVTSVDPSLFPAGKIVHRRFDLAVLHDCGDDGVNAVAKLFIFPEPWLKRSKGPPLLPVTGTAGVAELQSREGPGTLGTAVLLGPTRVVALPGWMEPLAAGAGAGEHDTFPLAATGHNADGEVGVIAFDIRNHLLLDPDRMDALVLTIDTLRRLSAPQDLKIVPTGTFVSVSTFSRATLISPAGWRSTLIPNQWGRVRFRPLEAGRYTVTGGSGIKIQVFANYYDAAESDLATVPPPPSGRSTPAANAAMHGEFQVEPAAFILIALALLSFVAESAMLTRRALRWGAGHV
jgi:hypothetical protein